MKRHENLVVDTSDVAVSVNQMRTILLNQSELSLVDIACINLNL